MNYMKLSTFNMKNHLKTTGRGDCGYRSLDSSNIDVVRQARPFVGCGQLWPMTGKKGISLEAQSLKQIFWNWVVRGCDDGYAFAAEMQDVFPSSMTTSKWPAGTRSRDWVRMLVSCIDDDWSFLLGQLSPRLKLSEARFFDSDEGKNNKEEW